MRRLSSPLIGVVVVVLVALAILAPLTFAGDKYTVKAVLPAGDPNIFEGSPVYIDGFKLGKIKSIQPEDNKAVILMSIDDKVAPLHDGAFVHVQWKALVGERTVFLDDGPDTNAVIPDGGMVPGDFPRPTEIGDVLNALDKPTREHLSSLVVQLDSTLQGREKEVNQTVRTAGPALAALGEVLRGIGTDGPAIKQLVTDLNEMVARIDSRNEDVRQVVQELSHSAAVTATKRRELRAALEKLPRTLDTARTTLAKVPSTTEETVPLLRDLGTATAKLPSVSKNLAPVLVDLRPMIAELKPTLRAASVLLERTPALLDTAHGTVPGVDTAATDLMPALEFLRPYTPEAVGFLTSWGSAGQNSDANGRYMRIFGQAGLSSLNTNPGVVPPGMEKDATPAPGEADDTAATGAYGEGMN